MGKGIETGVPGGRLTDAQIDEILAVRDKIAGSGIDMASDNALKFFVGFDGVKDTGRTTVIGALMERVIEGANVRAFYSQGMGPTSDFSAMYPLKESEQLAQKMISRVAEAVYNWRQTKPDGDITINMASFGRGVVSAAIFSQILDRDGLVYSDTDSKEQTILIAPGEVQISNNLVIGPVKTGVEAGLNMEFVDTFNTVVVDSSYDTRWFYEQARYNCANKEFSVYAQHCNMGNCIDYTYNGIDKALEVGYSRFFAAELPMILRAEDDVIVRENFRNYDEITIIASLSNWRNFCRNDGIKFVPAGTPTRIEVTPDGWIKTYVNFARQTIIEEIVGGITVKRTIVDKNGDVTTDYYEGALPLATRIENPDGSRTVNTYVGGVLTTSTNILAEGKIDRTIYTKGRRSGVTRTLRPADDGSITTNEYDSTGTRLRLSRVMSADGSYNERFYDGTERLTKETRIASQPGSDGQIIQTQDVTYYDPERGRVVGHGVQTITLMESAVQTFDSSGRLISSTTTRVDKYGNPISATMRVYAFDEKTGDLSSTIKIMRNSADQIVSTTVITPENVISSSFTYDNFGNVISGYAITGDPDGSVVKRSEIENIYGPKGLSSSSISEKDTFGNILRREETMFSYTENDIQILKKETRNTFDSSNNLAFSETTLVSAESPDTDLTGTSFRGLRQDRKKCRCVVHTGTGGLYQRRDAKRRQNHCYGCTGPGRHV